MRQAAKPSRGKQEPAPAVSPIGEAIAAATSANAFQRELEQYLARSGNRPEELNQQVAQFSNAAVSDASAALAEAWALRRLAERFAAQPDNELNPAARQRIAEMTRNHLARLKTHSGRLSARLEPILVAMTGERPAVSGAPLSPETTRLTQTLAVFGTVEQIINLTYGLIGGKGLSIRPEQAARQMLADFVRLENALLNLEREIDR